jgi:hypothetical protein
MTALRVSFGFNLESMKSMTTLRPAIPPCLLTVLAQAFITSTDDLKRPGTTGLSTSASTARRISVSVIPTSAAFGFALVAAFAAGSAAPIRMTAHAMTVAASDRENRMVPPGS